MAADRLERIGGHSGAILCCEHVGEGTRICTGSEDGTVGLFDVLAGERVMKIDLFEQESVASVVPTPGREHEIFAAAGKRIYCVDIRQNSECLHTYNCNTDEINQVAVNRRRSYAAAADDSGEVKVIDLQTGTLFKTLRGQHSNICSSVQFHPLKPWEVVTGALDSTVVLWDFSTGRRLRSWNNLTEEASRDSTEEESGSRLCNPPLVHTLRVSEGPPAWLDFRGPAVAVSRGDGAIGIYDLDARPSTSAPGSGRGQRGRRGGLPRGGVRSSGEGQGAGEGALVLHRAAGGHRSSVSHVVFSKMGGDRVQIVSGGNDKRLLLWSRSDSEEEISNSSSGSSSAQPRGCGFTAVEIQHKRKVNWLSTCSGGGGNLAVVDTSSKLSVYYVGDL